MAASLSRRASATSASARRQSTLRRDLRVRCAGQRGARTLHVLLCQVVAARIGLRSHDRAFDVRKQIGIVLLLRDGQRAREHLCLLFGVAQIHVAPGHLQQHARCELRIFAVSAIQQLDAAVDELLGRERLAARPDLFEHQAHELAGGLGALRLKPRDVSLTRAFECLRRRFRSLASRFDRLPRRAGDARDEHERNRRDCCDCESMPANELPHSIRARLGTRADRLIVEIALEIAGESVGSRVAIGGQLLQRLGDDVVEVAT